MDSARPSTIQQNAAAAQPTHIEIPGNRHAVVLDGDSHFYWHKALKGIDGAGAYVDWAGFTADRLAVNRIMARLRSLAANARAGGDKAAGMGIDRIVSALDAARRGNPSGRAIVLRGNYDEMTVLEERQHMHQLEHGLVDSEPVLQIAERPEFARAAENLRRQGYGQGDDAEWTRVEMALEMTAKAMIGDEKLGTAEERYEIANAYLEALAAAGHTEALKTCRR